jgi:hypothetical protein
MHFSLQYLSIYFQVQMIRSLLLVFLFEDFISFSLQYVYLFSGAHDSQPIPGQE